MTRFLFAQEPQRIVLRPIVAAETANRHNTIFYFSLLLQLHDPPVQASQAREKINKQAGEASFMRTAYFHRLLPRYAGQLPG